MSIEEEKRLIKIRKNSIKFLRPLVTITRTYLHKLKNMTLKRYRETIQSFKVRLLKRIEPLRNWFIELKNFGNIYWLLLLLGILFLFCPLITKSGVVETIVLSLGTGIVASTIVALLINHQSQINIIYQKKKMKAILLEGLYNSAYDTYFNLVKRFNYFVYSVHNYEFAVEYHGGLTIFTEMLNYKKIIDLENEKLSTKGRNIKEAFDMFRFFRFDFSIQITELKDSLYNLFIKRDNEFFEYINELHNSNIKLMFTLDIINQSELDKLSVTPTISELLDEYHNYRRLVMQYPHEIDIVSYAKFLSLLCTSCCNILEAIDFINNGKSIYNPQEMYQKIDREIAIKLYEENIGWEENTPASYILQNIQDKFTR